MTNIEDTFYYISSMVFVFGTLISMVLIVLITLIQLNALTKKLDPILFNRNHFNDFELHKFSVFPLSIFKIIAYQRAIILPFSMRRRFGYLDIRSHINIFDYILSLIVITLLFFVAIIIINGFIVIAIV